MENKIKHKIIFEAIVGSQSQGTANENSDIDKKGIYLQNNDDLLSFDYEPHISLSKDETYYELNRFMELLMEANPNALELLFSPEDCIISSSPQFDLLRENRHIFLTKHCRETFAGYASTQIKKAKGLNKKINWEEKRIERKTPIDFCYIHFSGKTYSLLKFLELFDWKQENCGLVKLNNFYNTYGLYYDSENKHKFKGIIGENSNELKLTSIDKTFADNYEDEVFTLYYNKDGYSTHCKDYKSYQTWIKERNENRYHTNVSHGQIYDSKNICHCFRLSQIAREIVIENNIFVRRNNIEYLLQIKHGEVPLDEILNEVELNITDLQNIYQESDLPDEVDKNLVKDLLLKIRKM